MVVLLDQQEDRCFWDLWYYCMLLMVVVILKMKLDVGVKVQIHVMFGPKITPKSYPHNGQSEGAKNNNSTWIKVWFHLVKLFFFGYFTQIRGIRQTWNENRYPQSIKFIRLMIRQTAVLLQVQNITCCTDTFPRTKFTWIVGSVKLVLIRRHICGFTTDITFSSRFIRDFTHIWLPMNCCGRGASRWSHSSCNFFLLL